MTMTDEEVRRVADIVRGQNGAHWSMDRRVSPVTITGAVVTGLLVIGGWIWFGATLTAEVKSHTAEIASITVDLRTATSSIIGTASDLRVISGSLGDIKQGVDQARTDRINSDAEIGKKLDAAAKKLEWLQDRLLGDERNGKIKPPPNGAPF